MNRTKATAHIVGILALMISGSASAVIVEQFHLDFASGAVWEGTITFNDGYQGMIDTEGYLNGGTWGFTNEYFSWTWWQGTGQTNPMDSNGDGYYNDWLMTGVAGGAYSMYIGLSWLGTSVQGGLTFANVLDPYYNGNQVYNDLIVNSYRVPEPGTVALFGLGLAGLGLSRRRKTH